MAKPPEVVTDPPAGVGRSPCHAPGRNRNRCPGRRPRLAQVEGTNLLQVRTVGAVGVRFCRRRFLTFPPHRTRQLLAAPSWEGRHHRSAGKRPPGRATELICGAFEFEGPDAKSFLAVLPEWIRVQKDERRGNEWLDATIRFLTRETYKPELGATTIITSLIDVLFVEAVRTWLKQQPPVAAGWLGALRDPSIGAALGLIHQAPEKRWTVPALSAAVGLSRSPFAAKFTALVGQSPMAYVKRWRLQRGASLLRHQALALSSVAEQVGYESAAAFSRAFTREFGRSPGRYRHDAAVGEASGGMTKLPAKASANRRSGGPPPVTRTSRAHDRRDRNKSRTAT
jgi:AraC-like DNA-binding protein